MKNKIIYEPYKTYGVGSGEVTSYFLRIENSNIRVFIEPENYDWLEFTDEKGHEHSLYVPTTPKGRQELIDLLIYAFGLNDD